MDFNSNYCSICNSNFTDRRNLLQHQREQHRPATDVECSASRIDSTVVETSGHISLHLLQHALRKFARAYQLRSSELATDASLFLNNGYGLLNILCGNILGEWSHGLKLLIALNIQFIRATDESQTIVAHFNSSQRTILRGSDIDYELKNAFDQILLKIDKFTEKGSGWTVNQILHGDLHIAKYQTLRGSTYKPLPSYLQSKKAIINVQNSDQRCFMWSVLAALFPAQRDSHRITKYVDNIKSFNFDCINYPASLKDVKKFENQNNLSVNVFGYEDKNIYPLHISVKSSPNEVDLLLHDNHYSTIKKLSALLQDQNKSRHKRYFCRRCLMHYYSEEDLSLHKVGCSNNEPARIVFPKDKTLKFRNWERMLRAPYVIYADFECILENIEQCQPPPEQSFTTKYQKHVACGFGLVEVLNCGCDGGINETKPPKIYRGLDAIEQFLETVCNLSENYKTQYDAPLTMTTSDWQIYNDSSECHVCRATIENSATKVRDHCHICGKYRGAAHQKCNSGYRLRKDIPIFFHNLRKYDLHLIMQKLAIICKTKSLEIDCIPKGLEDYLCLSVKKLRESRKRKKNDIDEECKLKDHDWNIKFLDSFQFLPSSLDVLVENLKTSSDNNFKSMKQNFTKEELLLLLQKGSYPYEYMNNFDKFEEKKLPCIEQFYSSLTESIISAEQYNNAMNIWNKMNCKTIGDYHDLYLKTDVLLLCDVFENFRKFSLQHFKLDPAHYITLPSFGWDACLKMTNIELELLQDADMYNFFEKGIRGGVSVISHRYAKANNPYLDNFQKELERIYIMYMDANNLYGYSMVQNLPVNNFHWLDRKQIDCIDWKQVDADGRTGWVLEVDLEYPATIHAKHNDYPLAPERLVVKDSMLSDYCQSLQKELGASSGVCGKLVPNLMNKTRYIVHIKNLQLYLSLGLELKCVHRVIEFDQRTWMKDYILFNTSMRKNAKSCFEKDLFKLLNNAVFGKTMENVRDYVDAKILSNEVSYLKWVGNPRFKQFSIFNDNLVAVMLQKSTVCLCKPIYVGFTVLDLSKHLMYDFHYNYIKHKYGDKAKLLFTDTDSLCYAINTNDIYDDINQNSTYFDTSDYPSDHPIYSIQNKKILGKMKDETNGVAIEEFVGLRSKMYSIKLGNEEKKRAKGVKKIVVKKHLRHQHYKDVLFNKTVRKDVMKMIRNEKHELYTIAMNKTSLSCFDDKRYLLSDGYSSFAYGNVAIHS